jgi:Sulfotransferase family
MTRSGSIPAEARRTGPDTDVAGWEEMLHRAAEQATGLSDFGDDDYRTGLRVLLESCRRSGVDDPLQSLAGQMTMGALVGRLVAERGWKDCPEWETVRPNRPIVIVGMFRTGTTALQRMLAADPANQGPEGWLLRFPQPRPPVETWEQNRGFVATKAALDALYAVDPGFPELHDIRAHLVDECWPLLQQSFVSAIFDFVFPRLEEYRRWYRDAGAVASYERHRDLLRLIFAPAPERRWILKCPTHIFLLDDLLEVYPDALVIHAHRHPREAVASGCSVISRFRQASGDTVEPNFGDCMVDSWSWAMNRFAELRAARPSAQFYDMHVADWARDPIAVIREIYAHFGIELTDEGQGAMKRWMVANPGGGHGPHRYSATDFGIDDERIGRAFAPYIEAFGLGKRQSTSTR